ncbi:tripartite tricarboxylate transporter permease [Psychrobacter aestuarii]|uniref:Tripartite tricarboxylate transporter permease n=1 Tax=Psychrobacter aestuarii TaxID=556327 RepID=A0ABP3F6M5_9GAMM|nr:tripartite tricarboxylate transporter permease [Psychrobacter aestuarii]
MFEIILSAFTDLLSVQHIMYMLVGVFLGILIGILPGLGGIVGFSILLPFLYGMDTTSALAMLIGMVSVIPTSDTFTSVLMGIPGSSASQATVLDGYPMAQKGEAARALGAAFFASMIGGLLGALFLSVFIIFARDLITQLGSAELFILGLIGLSMVGVLSGNSLIKGLLAAGVGLLLGSIGSAPATGESRMAMDIFYLYDGIKLVILGLGIYAIPEIVDLLIQNQRIAKDTTVGSGWTQGVKDVIKNKWIVARCAPLGAMIGAIPGLGGSVVDWIAYGHIVQSSKDKSQFGKGDVRGVIAPESANNAKEGGGLVPTLLFGIPGSGSMAVFLGALTILGIEPGPSMVGENLNITYTIIWSLALANVIGTLTCLLMSNKISKITTIPYGYVAPFMLMIVFFAALQATRSIEDLILLVVLGAVGCLFKYFDWSRPALLIGFVLAATVETYYYQAVQFYGWGMLERPGVMFLIGLMVVSFFVSVILKRRVAKRVSLEVDEVEENREGDVAAGGEIQRPSTEAEENPHRYSFITGELIFTIAVLAFAAFALISSSSLRFLGGIFPMAIAGIMLVSGIVLLWQLTNKNKQPDILTVAVTDENGKLKEDWTSLWKNFLLLPLFIFTTWFFGFIPSLAVLFIATIHIKVHPPIWKTLLITVIALSSLWYMSELLSLHLPEGYIMENFL